jgi:ATP-binding cassette subfamily B (MDR/TAP) protein 1
MYFDRYSRYLGDAKRSGIIKSMVSGGGMGMMYFVLFCSYCLAFWYGNQLINTDGYTLGKMVKVSCFVLKL